MNKLLECLKYCEEQNGIPKCKNCGLDKDMIDEALQERDKEMLRRDAPWLNAMIEDREKKALQEQRQHILSKLTELSRESECEKWADLIDYLNENNQN